MVFKIAYLKCIYGVTFFDEFITALISFCHN